MNRHSSLILALLLAGCSGGSVEEIRVAVRPEVTRDIEVAGSEWPWWRGPRQNNHAAGPAPPLEWSTDSNVLWRVSVPGRGHASPIICNDHVYVATADDREETQSVYCYSVDDGRLLWYREIHRGGFMHTHSKNSHASATPACDGQLTFVNFMVDDAIWVSALDRDGNVVWMTQAGPFSSMHGYGSSPVLHQSLVIVAGDNPDAGFLAALHRETGELVWRIRRKNGGNFGTPIVGRIDGRDQLLLSGLGQTTAYDPMTGDELWSVAGPSKTTANTMAWNERSVVSSGGYPERGLLCVKADGSGAVLWEKHFKAYVPSPLVDGERLYFVSDNGVAYCLDMQNGKEVWSERLGGSFSASPVLCNGLVFVPNEQGKMYILRAGDEFEKVGENELTPGGFATPVICDGRIYIRTNEDLFCIGTR